MGEIDVGSSLEVAVIVATPFESELGSLRNSTRSYPLDARVTSPRASQRREGEPRYRTEAERSSILLDGRPRTRAGRRRWRGRSPRESGRSRKKKLAPLPRPRRRPQPRRPASRGTRRPSEAVDDDPFAGLRPAVKPQPLVLRRASRDREGMLRSRPSRGACGAERTARARDRVPFVLAPARFAPDEWPEKQPLRLRNESEGDRRFGGSTTGREMRVPVIRRRPSSSRTVTVRAMAGPTPPLTASDSSSSLDGEIQ